MHENTEGDYTNLGGVMCAGTEREVVIEESVFSRRPIRAPVGDILPDLGGGASTTEMGQAIAALA